jgi:hypothetical protein
MLIDDEDCEAANAWACLDPQQRERLAWLVELTERDGGCRRIPGPDGASLELTLLECGVAAQGGAFETRLRATALGQRVVAFDRRFHHQMGWASGGLGTIGARAQMLRRS